MADETTRGKSIPLLFHYAAALFGLIVAVIGVVDGLHGVAKVVLPKSSTEVVAQQPSAEGQRGGRGAEAQRALQQEASKEIEKASLNRIRQVGWREGLEGLLTAAVGAPIFLWFFTQARRRESGGPTSPPTSQGSTSI